MEMKNKIISIISTILIIIALIIIYLNRTTGIVSLDINPSIKILLKRNNVVKDVIALNSDAKEVINNKLIGNKIDVVINDIVNNLIEKDYIRDNNSFILIGNEGNISNSEIDKMIRKTLSEKSFDIAIIFIDDITKEDKELAKKYNITDSKAAYINKINKDKNIDIDYLVNKSIV